MRTSSQRDDGRRPPSPARARATGADGERRGGHGQDAPSALPIQRGSLLRFWHMRGVPEVCCCCHGAEALCQPEQGNHLCTRRVREHAGSRRVQAQGAGARNGTAARGRSHQERDYRTRFPPKDAIDHDLIPDRLDHDTMQTPLQTAFRPFKPPFKLPFELPY
jgi:hypothetical protein